MHRSRPIWPKVSGSWQQTPRMNAIAGRWTGGCRRELLDRTPIWNQNHLRQVLRQYESHHNEHRPHRSLDAAVPLKPLPQPVVLEQHRVRRTRVSDTIHEFASSRTMEEILGTHTSRSRGIGRPRSGVRWT